MVWKAGYVAGALALVLLPGVASAQMNETRGFYLGLGAGVNWREDADVSGFANDMDFDNPGWLGSLFGGYDFGGPRLELELAYRGNNPDSILGGYVHQGAVMVNLLYDISISGFPVTPYIGIGGGYNWAGYTAVEKDSGFAYQGIVGLSYDITRNMSLFVDYRYFGSEDHDIRFAGASRDIENTTHNVLAGLRYTFGAPPPPPPPATVTPPPPPPPPVARPAPPPPPAAVVRSYLVFFDWDRSNLTPEAQRIVQTAAQNARSAAVTRINVTGHADRSGSPQYNVGLSRRRAEAVAAELVRSGINRNEIAIFARGEAEPLVPTPDGVREPQNRRVEIVLQ